MEIFGRVFIVLCLALLATPLRSARFKLDLSPDHVTGAAARLEASTPLPDSSSENAQVGQETFTDAPDVLPAREAEAIAEKQDLRTFQQADAHSRSQRESESVVSSTVVQDGKASTRMTGCVHGRCKTANTKQVFSKDLGDSGKASHETSTGAHEGVPPRETASNVTTDASKDYDNVYDEVSKDDVVKSLQAEGAAEKQGGRPLKQASAHSRSHGVITVMYLEVGSIFALMGCLSYIFSLCL